jgi:hypothetical protein
MDERKKDRMSDQEKKTNKKDEPEGVNIRGG